VGKYKYFFSLIDLKFFKFKANLEKSKKISQFDLFCYLRRNVLKIKPKELLSLFFDMKRS